MSVVRETKIYAVFMLVLCVLFFTFVHERAERIRERKIYNDQVEFSIDQVFSLEKELRDCRKANP